LLAFLALITKNKPGNVKATEASAKAEITPKIRVKSSIRHARIAYTVNIPKTTE
jgi:hypothetical protein